MLTNSLDAAVAQRRAASAPQLSANDLVISIRALHKRYGDRA